MHVRIRVLKTYLLNDVFSVYILIMYYLFLSTFRRKTRLVM